VYDFFGQLTSVHLNQPAVDSEISMAEQELCVQFPDEYQRLLKRSNGFVGEYGENNKSAFIALYSVSELARVNSALHIAELQPGALVIGTNGGDEQIGLDLRKDHESYGSFIQTPFLMNWKDTWFFGKTVEEFLEDYMGPR
jgi:hypothetical protein